MRGDYWCVKARTDQELADFGGVTSEVIRRRRLREDRSNSAQ
jgi:hypothetical protein